MAKRGFLSDGSSSGDSDHEQDDWEENSQEDETSAAERRLFEGAGGKSSKRRKRNKEDAWTGVFGEGDMDGGRPGRRGNGNKGLSDFTKAPTFTSAGQSSTALQEVFIPPPPPGFDDSKQDSDEESEEDEGMESNDNDEEDDDDDSSDSDGEKKPASPRVRDESDEEEDVPMKKGFGARMGGITPLNASPSITSPPVGVGAPTRGGIGSSSKVPPPPVLASPLPSFFGREPSSAPKATSKFAKQSASNSRPGSPAVQLSKEDTAALAKTQGSFGAKMLAKMGWTAGVGLGKDGDGIVAPIQTKVRARGSGIGEGERTEQSLREAIRRGEIVEPKETQKKGGKKEKKERTQGDKLEQEKDSQAWKRQKKIKSKVVHMTYDEIVSAASSSAQQPHQVIIDATGSTLREVNSLSALPLHSWTPSTDSMKLPELRHNIRLISDVTKGDLDALAREGAAVSEKRKWSATEITNLTKIMEIEETKIQRLESVRKVVGQVVEISTDVANLPIAEQRLEVFEAVVEKLLFDFSDEYKMLGLDEVVVGAIAPVLRKITTQWNPLDSDSSLFTSLRKFKKAFRFTPSPAEDPNTQVDVFGRSSYRPPKTETAEKTMTAFETLLYTLWLPKVRSSFNNEFSPSSPTKAVEFLTTWKPMVPTFIMDNIIDQVILPKVLKAVTQWKDGSGSLRGLIFPWFELFGSEGDDERMDNLLDEGKRRLKHTLLKNWNPASTGTADEVAHWKGVFSKEEWESFLLKYVLPKLGATLREEFAVNPRDQKMSPLEDVLMWAKVLPGKMLGQLLELEFWPKWLEVLFQWLTAPGVSLDQVSQWYQYWKSSVFPDSVLALPSVQQGFVKGLDLMNQAITLGPEKTPTHLRRASYAPSTAASKPTISSTKKSALSGLSSAVQEEVTFRSIAEEYATSQNLVWVATGRSHAITGNPLFRVSSGLSGTGSKGVVVYVSNDAVYVVENGEGSGRAVGLEEMAKLANGSGAP